MKKDTVKKINYGTRNMILNVLIAIMILLIAIMVVNGVKNYNKKIIYDEKSFIRALDEGNYAQVMSMYSTDYDPSKSYSDTMMECYSCAEFYRYASQYYAAVACDDKRTAEIEKKLMDDAYNKMGSKQKYASEMEEQLKKDK